MFSTTFSSWSDEKLVTKSNKLVKAFYVATALIIIGIVGTFIWIFTDRTDVDFQMKIMLAVCVVSILIMGILMYYAYQVAKELKSRSIEVKGLVGFYEEKSLSNMTIEELKEQEKSKKFFGNASLFFLIVLVVLNLYDYVQSGDFNFAFSFILAIFCFTNYESLKKVRLEIHSRDS